MRPAPVEHVEDLEARVRFKEASMEIRDILRSKGHDVVTIAEDRTVLEAVTILTKHNIGSVMVVDGECPTGILTEKRCFAPDGES